MKRSLQYRLSSMLGLAIVSAGIIASFASFFFGYNEAQEIQDDALRQVAAISNGTYPEQQSLDAAEQRIEDPESRIQVFLLPEGLHPKWVPTALKPGFHTLDTHDRQGRMRVFVRAINHNVNLVVVQSTESRDEIAFNSALRTLIPMLVLLPLLLGLMAQIVQHELTSIRDLSDRLDQLDADKLCLLSEHNLPGEIVPFIQAINRLLGRVDRLVSEQQRFIADAAHELRTPLTALSIQAQNLAQADSPEVMHERLIPLQAGIERARKMTVQLLELARVQAGSAHTETVDIPSLARELIAEYLPLAESKLIDLGLESVAPLSLQADPDAIRLILRNGLDNALKYTPQGGEVTLRLSQEGTEAVIEIIDNGPGIASNHLDRVFDAFYRLSNSSVEGSGLGLAIAREASTRLGGSVTLRTQSDGDRLIFCYKQSLAFKTA